MSALEFNTVGVADLEARVRELVGLWATTECVVPASLPYDGAMLAEAVGALLQADVGVRSRLAFETNLLAELFAHVSGSAHQTDTFHGPVAP